MSDISQYINSMVNFFNAVKDTALNMAQNFAECFVGFPPQVVALLSGVVVFVISRIVLKIIRG